MRYILSYFALTAIVLYAAITGRRYYYNSSRRRDGFHNPFRRGSEAKDEDEGEEEIVAVAPHPLEQASAQPGNIPNKTVARRAARDFLSLNDEDFGDFATENKPIVR